MTASSVALARRTGMRAAMVLALTSFLFASGAQAHLPATTVSWAAPAGSTDTILGAKAEPAPITGDRLQGDHPDLLVRRIQTGLAEIGIYKGAVNGIMDVELRSAIRVYQKRNGIPITGAASEELAVHLETAQRVDVLLKRLDKVREEKIEAARQALLAHPRTRGLIADRIDDIADPTRNPEPCFRKPTARCLLVEASESAKAIATADMRDWALGELLVAQAKVGLTEAAMETVRRISDPRLIMVALRDIAEGLASSGRNQEALQASDIIPDVSRKADALVAVLAIAAARNDAAGVRAALPRLMDVVDTTPESVRQVALLGQAATSLARIGDTDAAEDTLARARDLADTKVPAGERGTAFRYIATAWAEMGRTERALAILDQLQDPADRTPVLIATSGVQADAGHVNEAHRLAATIESARYRAVALGQVATAFVKAGRMDDARATLVEAKSAIGEITFPYALAFALSRFAQTQIEIGKVGELDAFDQAVATAKEIKDDQLRAQTLWAIATARRRHGDVAGASATAEAAQRALNEIKSTLSRVWLFGDITASHVAAGEREPAWEAFRNGLGVAANVHNSWARARALSKLATTLAMLTREDGAFVPNPK